MQTSLLRATCLHCGSPTKAGAKFCCGGCESVNSLLIERGLGHFYELKDQFAFKSAVPAASPDENDPISSFNGPNARLYLEGIHCIGCLWLLEKLPEIDPRILSSTLDLSHQILEIHIRPTGISWAEVVQLISRLGYRAMPLAYDDLGDTIRCDHRRQAIRLGVAGFCAGNIMLLSVSIYSGAESWWVARFAWLSFFLAIPVLGYAAWPIYRAALLPLRKGRISVDLAIALALLAGTTASLWSLLTEGGRQTYFDSLSMLVFLLLSSRLLLSRFRENLAKEKPYLSFLANERFSRINPRPGKVCSDELLPGDHFELQNGQNLPVDSVLGATAHFDLSLLTGESVPTKFLSGDSVEAGSRLLSEATPLRAVRPASQSRLAQIMEQVRSFQLKRSPSLDFADRMGRTFVVVVLCLASITWIYFSPGDGFYRALALVIVTCPCVLAFAVPLTLVRGMQQAARKGILFRTPEKLEALASADSLFLDKTGTLTTGNFQVLSWEEIGGATVDVRTATASLEACSTHPVAKALSRFLAASSRVAVSKFRENPGRGVQGMIGCELWTVERLRENTVAGENHLGIFCDDNLRAKVILGDAPRAESLQALAKLRGMGLTAVLLSGDHEATVSRVARDNMIRDWHSGLSPEGKAAIVAREPRSIMVGDGANDSVAFQAASVGIAIQGAVDLSLKNADVALTKPGLSALVEAVRLSQKTMQLVKKNFRFTLAYNCLAGILAISGHMSPLIAAVLMPMSALTVFAYTQWQTREGAL